MEKFITLSKIRLQILGSYMHIYLNLIPRFYIKEFISFCKTEINIYFIFGCLPAIGMLIVMLYMFAINIF